MNEDSELFFLLVFIGIILLALGKAARKGIGILVEWMVTIALLCFGAMWIGNILLGRPVGVTPNWVGILLFIPALAFLIKRIQETPHDK